MGFLVSCPKTAPSSVTASTARNGGAMLPGQPMKAWLYTPHIGHPVYEDIWLWVKTLVP